MREYQGTYTDSAGEDPAVVRFDATTIGFTTRGVEFMGGPDGYMADLPAGSPALAPFTFVENRVVTADGLRETQRLLAEFKLCWGMPVGVVAHGREYPGEIRVIYHLLDPGGMRDQEGGEQEGGETVSHSITNLIDLTLFYSYQRHSMTSGGDFEKVLNYLIAAMGSGVHLQACIACAYGDYPLSGHGCYGSMLCFRNLKEEYRRITDKPGPDRNDYLSLSHDERVIRTGELYVCPEFQPKTSPHSRRKWPGEG